MELHNDSGDNHPKVSWAAASETSAGNAEALIIEEKKAQSNAASRNTGFSFRAPEISGKFSAGGLANWAKGLRMSSPSMQDTSSSGEAGKNPFNLLTNGFGRRSSTRIPVVEVPLESPSSAVPSQEGALETFAKGILDSSKNAVKAVQTKARHLVSQNKIRYQEGGFDLDLAYITDNIIAMGFPAGDMSSGLLGYVEGLYRNHMEEVIKFFETHHKDKYKVYNLCSERLYDASLFEGKVACFPFNDHNCPPLQLVAAFCHSAYSWLKADLENVVVVHCKAGKARTGLMIASLLLYLKFFPTAEESIAYYNKKRCVDGKGLILPSQLRYVKYFERVLRNCNGETPIGRKVVLRGFRLHKCPYWIRPSITILDHDGIVFSSKKHPRTKDMMPEDIWFNAPRKGIMVFALPGERGLADLNGDFKVFFHDRHGDFYCWLNTNMMENRTMLGPADLDGFDKRKLPSPGFQVEIVILDYDAAVNSKPSSVPPAIASPAKSEAPIPGPNLLPSGEANKLGDDEKDDVFSDSESESSSMGKSKVHRPRETVVSSQDLNERHAPLGTPGDVESAVQPTVRISQPSDVDTTSRDAIRSSTDAKDISNVPWDDQHKQETKDASNAQASKSDTHEPPVKSDAGVSPTSDFKAMAAASAADASVFTFGDEEDYESEDE